MTQKFRALSLGLFTLFGGLLVSITGCNGEQSESEEPAPAESTQAGGEGETPEATDAREGWPTEQEAIDTILKVEREIRASPSNREIWHITDLLHEVQSVEFADKTVQKWMDVSSEDVTTYPAHIVYTRITEYSDQPDTVEECGADGTWWIYRDPFGEWTAKYGTD